MLFTVGVLATTLYWPGVSAAATTPRWAALALIVPWMIRDELKLTPAHGWGLAFLTVAGVSFLWTPAPLDAIHQCLLLLIWVVLFCVGTQTADLRPLYLGAGAGLCVSSAIAIVQWLGGHPLPEIIFNRPFGLFINGNYLAEAAALIFVAAFSERIWWLLPALLPSLLLPQARGAVVATAAALAAYLWPRSRISSVALILALCAAGVAFFVFRNAGVGERLIIWQSTMNGLTFWGHGLGSFWSLYPMFDLRVGATEFPEYAHNEFLHIAFELGVPGLVAALGFCLFLAAGPLDTSRLVLLTLFVESCFAFPLHLPATAAVGFLVAGHAVRLRYLRRRVLFDRRMACGVELENRPSWISDALRDGGRTSVPFRPPFSRSTFAPQGT